MKSSKPIPTWYSPNSLPPINNFSYNLGNSAASYTSLLLQKALCFQYYGQASYHAKEHSKIH